MSSFVCFSICENYCTLSRWRPQGVKRLEGPTELAGETSPLDGAQRRKNGGLLHLAIRRPASQSARIHGRQAMYRNAPFSS